MSKWKKFKHDLHWINILTGRMMFLKYYWWKLLWSYIVFCVFSSIILTNSRLFPWSLSSELFLWIYMVFQKCKYFVIYCCYLNYFINWKEENTLESTWPLPDIYPTLNSKLYKTIKDVFVLRLFYLLYLFILQSLMNGIFHCGLFKVIFSQWLKLWPVCQKSFFCDLPF